MIEQPYWPEDDRPSILEFLLISLQLAVEQCEPIERAAPTTKSRIWVCAGRRRRSSRSAEVLL
jgi:hypothetical protein